MIIELNPAKGKALVLFLDRTNIWWLKWLRRGFRHCSVVVGAGAHWVHVDPLSHRTVVGAVLFDSYAEVRDWLERCEDVMVVEAELFAAPPRCAPVAIFSCVEAVKRVLGLQDRWILTPYQLYRSIKSKDTTFVLDKKPIERYIVSISARDASVARPVCAVAGFFVSLIKEKCHGWNF